MSGVTVREDAVPEAAPAQPGVEALFRAHAPELGRYLVAMVRWVYEKRHSTAHGERCIVAHFADGSTVEPFPEVPCP